MCRIDLDQWSKLRSVVKLTMAVAKLTQAVVKLSLGCEQID